MYSVHVLPAPPVEFHPVLLVVDAVTEVERVYTGPYTMTALAGGTTLSSMRAFNKTWQGNSLVTFIIPFTPLCLDVYR